MMFFPVNSEDYIVKTLPGYEAHNIVSKFLPAYHERPKPNLNPNPNPNPC